jgi:hypothetical protein
VTDDERHATAVHESGHVVVASAVGWKPGAMTLEGGRALTGCSFATPPPVCAEALALLGTAETTFTLWPSAVRERVERDALVTMAGDIAKAMFVPRSGRMPEPVSIPAGRPASLGDLPPPTDAERRATAAAVDDLSVECDALKVERLGRVAHGPDIASAACWLQFLEQQCRALLLRHKDRVAWLAIVLAESGTLGAEAVAALVRDHP